MAWNCKNWNASWKPVGRYLKRWNDVIFERGQVRQASLWRGARRTRWRQLGAPSPIASGILRFLWMTESWSRLSQKVRQLLEKREAEEKESHRQKRSKRDEASRRRRARSIAPQQREHLNWARNLSREKASKNIIEFQWRFSPVREQPFVEHNLTFKMQIETKNTRLINRNRSIDKFFFTLPLSSFGLYLCGVN